MTTNNQSPSCSSLRDEQLNLIVGTAKMEFLSKLSHIVPNLIDSFVQEEDSRGCVSKIVPHVLQQPDELEKFLQKLDLQSYFSDGICCVSFGKMVESTHIPYFCLSIEPARYVGKWEAQEKSSVYYFDEILETSYRGDDLTLTLLDNDINTLIKDCDLGYVSGTENYLNTYQSIKLSDIKRILTAGPGYNQKYPNLTSCFYPCDLVKCMIQFIELSKAVKRTSLSLNVGELICGNHKDLQNTIPPNLESINKKRAEAQMPPLNEEDLDPNMPEPFHSNDFLYQTKTLNKILSICRQ